MNGHPSGESGLEELQSGFGKVKINWASQNHSGLISQLETVYIIYINGSY